MELPLKEIKFTPGENINFGLFANSLVKSPAIEENAVFFNTETKTMFSVNEESRIVFGPALIPDKLVYRNNGKEEFNLFVTKETIELIAIDFAENGRFNNVNLDHENKIVESVPIFQCLVTNKNTVPSVKGWEHLPEGTLFYGAKVKNDQVWQDIKAGKYNGWSIHAFFKQEPVKYSLEDSDIDTLVKEILNSL